MSTGKGILFLFHKECIPDLTDTYFFIRNVVYQQKNHNFVETNIYLNIMDTQLVKLDAPYNVIFDSKRRFGLHIATLIVVDEVTTGQGRFARTNLRSRSFPVVNTAFSLEGEVWIESELNSCHRICRQKETISLYDLRKFMKYSYSHGVRHLDDLPMSFNVAMMSYDIKMNFFDSSTCKKVSDFEIELLFDEGKKRIGSYLSENSSYIPEGVCLVHTDSESSFYFWSAFQMDKEKAEETINELAALRDAYLHAFKFDGLKSITFTTKNEKYQGFVDSLNNTQSV